MPYNVYELIVDPSCSVEAMEPVCGDGSLQNIPKCASTTYLLLKYFFPAMRSYVRYCNTLYVSATCLYGSNDRMQYKQQRNSCKICQ